MDILINTFRKSELEELEKQERAILFKYVDVDLSNVRKEDILELIKGDENAFIKGNLYTRLGEENYEIDYSDFLNRKDCEHYRPLLKELAIKKGFSKKNIESLFSNK